MALVLLHPYAWAVSSSLLYLLLAERVALLLSMLAMLLLVIRLLLVPSLQARLHLR
jgi:hypothetical protein